MGQPPGAMCRSTRTSDAAATRHRASVGWRAEGGDSRLWPENVALVRLEIRRRCVGRFGQPFMARDGHGCHPQSEASDEDDEAGPGHDQRQDEAQQDHARADAELHHAARPRADVVRHRSGRERGRTHTSVLGTLEARVERERSLPERSEHWSQARPGSHSTGFVGRLSGVPAADRRVCAGAVLGGHVKGAVYSPPHASSAP
jgi:hypothetical protein